MNKYLFYYEDNFSNLVNFRKYPFHKESLEIKEIFNEFLDVFFRNNYKFYYIVGLNITTIKIINEFTDEMLSNLLFASPNDFNINDWLLISKNDFNQIEQEIKFLNSKSLYLNFCIKDSISFFTMYDSDGWEILLNNISSKESQLLDKFFSKFKFEISETKC